MPPLRRSALWHALTAAGARMRVEESWEIVDSVGDGAAGERALRRGVGLADGSARFFRALCGAELASWVPSLPAVGSISILTVQGRSALCCRLTDERALLMSGEPIELPVPTGSCAHQVDLTSAFTRILVGGPASLTLLRAATSFNIGPAAFPDGRCAQSSLARVPATLIHRDRGGLSVYEILVARDVGEYVWDVLIDAGDSLDAAIVPAAAFGPEV